jgi:serine protease Do
MRKCMITASIIWLSILVTVPVVAETSYAGLGEAYGYGEEAGTGSYLGVDISDVTTERLSALKLKDERGVEVTMVDQDAPAGKAGLKEHDVILTMNGTNIESGAQLRRMIHETRPGRVVSFGISRDGQPLTIKVQLSDKGKALAKNFPHDFKFEMPVIPTMPDLDLPMSVVVVHSSMRSGLVVENLSPQLGEFFGAKNGKGVLVRSVDKGSVADKAGFRAGDVIVRVNDQTVHDTSDFTHALRSRSNNSVNVAIIREKKEQTLTLSLPQPKDSSNIFEESFELPDFDAETRIDLSEMQSEMAHLRPELELASQEARRVVESVRPQIEQARRALCGHRDEPKMVQKEMRQRAREMRQQVQERHHRLRERQKKYQEQLRHELNGDWIEI